MKTNININMNVEKYIKKPVEIEAIQLNFATLQECLTFCQGKINTLTGKFEIKTLEGVMTADIGDFIIKGIKGEFYPCKPEIFKASYSLKTTPRVKITAPNPFPMNGEKMGQPLTPNKQAWPLPETRGVNSYPPADWSNSNMKFTKSEEEDVLNILNSIFKLDKK